jgi:hypothetical protein
MICQYCGAYKPGNDCQACYNNKESLTEFEQED